MDRKPERSRALVPVFEHSSEEIGRRQGHHQGVLLSMLAWPLDKKKAFVPCKVVSFLAWSSRIPAHW